MRTKVEIIKTTPTKGELSWAVVMKEDGTMLHDIPVSTMSYSKYKALIEKNHPEYDFVPEMVINAPSPTIVEASTKYQTEDLKQAFDVSDAADSIPEVISETTDTNMSAEALDKMGIKLKEELIKNGVDVGPDDIVSIENGEIYIEKKTVPDNVDQETVEILNSPQLNNNNDMSTNQEPVSEVQGTMKKRSITDMAIMAGKVFTKIAIQTVTVPTHASLTLVARTAQTGANATRNLEAYALDKLHVTKNTRQELRDNVEARTDKIQEIVLVPVSFTYGSVMQARDAFKAMTIKRQTSVQPA